MADLYHYTDPRGRRSGPFSEQELKNLAARGLLEPEGRIELLDLGTPWSVSEVDWLRDAFPLAPEAPSDGAAPLDGGDPATAAPGPSTPSTPPAPPPPPDAAAGSGPDATERPAPDSAPATTPLAAPDRSMAGSPSSGPTPAAAEAPLRRSTYVLLALLPAFFGVFGVHNVVAGFIGRGIAQLVLSLFTLGGLAGGLAFPPSCCCFGLPMYLGLLVWIVLEAATQATDARGRPMP
jgi:hypothetical protein